MATMDLPTARTRRAALIPRLNGIILWTVGPEMQALDFYDMKARMDRYQDNFATLENANAIVAGAAESDEERNALWAEFNGIEDQFLTAFAAMNRRFVQITPHVAPLLAADGADVAAAGAVAGQADQRAIIVQMPFQPGNMQETWGTFNGDLLEWQDFRARFELGVHDRDDIPPAYKLALLRNALKGPAAQAAKGWILKPENYGKAWNELVASNTKRYPLACAYLSRFFALKNMGAGPAAVQLQSMSNETNELVRQLRDLQYPVDQCNLIIVHALQDRLDAHFADKWETERAGNDEPTIEQMTKFLDLQATKLLNKGLAYPALQVAVSNERAHRSQLQSVVHRSSQAAQGGQPKAYPCSACGSFDHLVYNCPEFKPLSVKERLKIVYHNELCINCLKRGHRKDKCFDRNRCLRPECKEDDRHNSLLCPFKNQAHHAMVASYDDQSSSSSHDGQSAAYRASHGRGHAPTFKRPASRQS